MKTEKLFLKSVKIKKAREYSRCYGKYDIHEYPLAFVEGNKLSVLQVTGHVERTFKIGTRLMPTFEGKEITKRTFQTNRNKLLASSAIAKAKSAVDQVQIEVREQAIEEARREATIKAFTDEVKHRFINKWASIATKPNYISHKQANSFAWKKQGYLQIDDVDIVELRALVKEAINV